jgi:hypothetical protein
MRRCSLVLASLLVAAGAPAQVIRAQATGLVSPQHVVDFGSGVLPNFTVVTTQFPGLTISHASYFTTGSINGLSGGFLTNNYQAGQPNTLTIRFATPISAVSFVYHQVGTSRATVYRAVLAGVTMASFAELSNQSQTNNRFGFTGLVFDEIQVDFDTDFNLDTLAYNDVGAACATMRNGPVVNPAAYTTSQRPIVGATWQAQIASSATTLGTYVAFAFGGQDPGTPTPFGARLVAQSPSPLVLSVPGAVAIAIPNRPEWLGYSFSTQGIRLDGAAIVLLNAIDLIGGY